MMFFCLIGIALLIVAANLRPVGYFAGINLLNLADNKRFNRVVFY